MWHASTTEILYCMPCCKTTFIDLKLIFHNFCGIFQCSVRGRRPWDPRPAALWKLCWDGGQFCRYTWQHGRTGGHPLQHLVAWSHAGSGGALEVHKCAGPGQHHTVPCNAGLRHRSEGRGWCFLCSKGWLFWNMDRCVCIKQIWFSLTVTVFVFLTENTIYRNLPQIYSLFYIAPNCWRPSTTGQFATLLSQGGVA